MSFITDRLSDCQEKLNQDDIIKVTPSGLTKKQKEEGYEKYDYLEYIEICGWYTPYL